MPAVSKSILAALEKHKMILTKLLLPTFSAIETMRCLCAFSFDTELQIEGIRHIHDICFVLNRNDKNGKAKAKATMEPLIDNGADEHLVRQLSTTKSSKFAEHAIWFLSKASYYSISMSRNMRLRVLNAITRPTFPHSPKSAMLACDAFANMFHSADIDWAPYNEMAEFCIKVMEMFEPEISRHERRDHFDAATTTLSRILQKSWYELTDEQAARTETALMQTLEQCPQFVFRMKYSGELLAMLPQVSACSATLKASISIGSSNVIRLNSGHAIVAKHQISQHTELVDLLEPMWHDDLSLCLLCCLAVSSTPSSLPTVVAFLKAKRTSVGDALFLNAALRASPRSYMTALVCNELNRLILRSDFGEISACVQPICSELLFRLDVNKWSRCHIIYVFQQHTSKLAPACLWPVLAIEGLKADELLAAVDAQFVAAY